MSSSDKPLPAPRVDPVERALRTFRRNLDALRVFAGEIGQLADKRDRQVIDQFTRTLKGIFGGELTIRVEEAEPAKLGSGGPDTAGEGAKPTHSPSEEQTESSEEPAKAKELLSDPKKRDAFFRAMNAMSRRHPAQGDILRRGAVVSLMSHFESLVADLIHAFYTLHPAALPADERTLTLAELRTLGSIEDAQAYLISQEVDAVLRETLERQLEYFTKRPKVDSSLLKPYREGMIEVDQRRNLYVHNRGRVNRRYLARVKPELVHLHSAEDGKPLRSNDAYVAAAIDNAFLVGTLLGQLCWRKWEPGQTKKADTDFIMTLYEELRAARYLLVESLAGAGDQLEFDEDESRRIVLVNRAIALRELDRKSEVTALLDETDWSACDLRFRVALQVLLDEDEAAFKTIRKAVAAEEIAAEELREWPLFRRLREEAEFQALFRELFPMQQLVELQPAEDTDT